MEGGSSAAEHRPTSSSMLSMGRRSTAWTKTSRSPTGSETRTLAVAPTSTSNKSVSASCTRKALALARTVKKQGRTMDRRNRGRAAITEATPRGRRGRRACSCRRSARGWPARGGRHR
ncbi:hypothetical protein SORBI_3009G074200 [Sorghum bicolor]|uniref:Uncharacterized protein n=1 Tax=Sorghum bicolor TaxID=4558 RepID=A0A1B6P7E8_SORBI|nr:hypothetical protein SORBI_3009G074200 [Sorghum bicolor]